MMSNIVSVVLLLITIFIKYTKNKTPLYLCIKNNIISEFLFINIILFSFMEKITLMEY